MNKLEQLKNEVREKSQNMLEAIVKKIRETYSETVWLPIPEEAKAKDAVAADLLRTMAPSSASLALEVLEPFLDAIIADTVKRVCEDMVVEEKDLPVYIRLAHRDKKLLDDNTEMLKLLRQAQIEKGKEWGIV